MELPEWVTKTSSTDSRRRYVHVLGSNENPLVIRNHAFHDAVIELGDEFAVHFVDCTFERSPWTGSSLVPPKPVTDVTQGNLVHLVQKGCKITDERPPAGTTRMKKVGTASNPIVFHGVTFPYTRLELGSIHARFVE